MGEDGYVDEMREKRRETVFFSLRERGREMKAGWRVLWSWPGSLEDKIVCGEERRNWECRLRLDSITVLYSFPSGEETHIHGD